MKTRIKKIMIIAAALLFVSSGVAFAHDYNSSSVKQDKRWHSLGHHQKATGAGWHRNKPNVYVYKHYGPGYRQFYHRPYYPKKYPKRHPYYRHQSKYPRQDTFFFSFSVR